MDPSSRVDVWAKGLRVRTRVYGASHPSTLWVRLEYAVARHRNGDSAAALADITDLIELLEDAPTPDESLIRAARAWRGRILCALGQLDEAERELRELAQEADRLLGMEDPMSLETHESHALVLHKLGLNEQAEAELDLVVAVRTAVSGADTEGTVRARSSQAALFFYLGRFDDSEKAWRAIAGTYDRRGKQTCPDALKAQENHAVALYELGRVHQAAAEFVQLGNRLAAARGMDHPDTMRVWRWRDRAIRASADA